MQNQPRKENEARDEDDKNCYSNSDCFNEKTSFFKEIWKWFKINDAACVAIGTFALAFATLILAIFTCDSVRYTKRLAEDSHFQIGKIEKMSKATQDMAIATQEMTLTTQKSTFVAESSIAITERGFEIVNTPYFSCYDEKAFFRQNTLYISCKIKNVGKTPALKILNMFIIRFTDTNAIDTLKPIRSNWKDSVMLMMPEDEITIEEEKTYDENKFIKPLFSNEMNCFLSIVIQYDDIFNHSYFYAQRLRYDNKIKRFATIYNACIYNKLK